MGRGRCAVGESLGAVRPGRASLSLAVVALLLCAPAAVVAQEAPPATATRALRGLALGAAGGGVLGGLGLGVLAWGLCDTGDCDGSFQGGFLVGMLVGGAAGGVAGTVVGSAFPADGPAVGGWSVTLRGGGRWASGEGAGGTAPALGLQGLRATTTRTWFGLAGEYLGSLDERRTFMLRTRDGDFVERSTRRQWWISSVRLVAARALGPDPEEGLHLLAGVGVYPTVERFSGELAADTRNPTPFRDTSVVPAPGVGVGVGWGIPLSGRWRLELEARGDVLAGVGPDDLFGLAQVTVGLGRGRAR